MCGSCVLIERPEHTSARLYASSLPKAPKAQESRGVGDSG